jgi:hypothetical protein
MAKDSLGSIITIGAVGLGAYWLYTNFFSSTVAAAPAVAPATGSTTPAAPAGAGTPTATTTPVWMANLNALATQLQTMSGTGAAQDIDQWVYYYNQLRQTRNMPTLTSDQIIALLNVNPATASNRTTPIAASEFVNDIFGLGYGLQGVRRGMGAVRGRNPIMPVRFRSGYIVGRSA